MANNRTKTAVPVAVARSGRKELSKFMECSSLQNHWATNGGEDSDRCVVSVSYQNHRRRSHVAAGFVVLHSPHGMAGRTQDQSGNSGSQLEYPLRALWANGVVIFR